MSADDALPWTTSRCNRLLRPLSSKLAKLRKELERPPSSPAEPRGASSAFATKQPPNKTTNFTRPAHKPRGFDKATDPDWRPGAKPAAAKKTYGGRGARKLAGGLRREGASVRHVSRPGEIAFTPLMARMGGQLQSSPTAQMSPLKKYGKNRGPLLVNSKQFQPARHMHPDLHKLVQRLLEAYANLLQATTTGHEKRWKGTRSLMGACLRRLPSYIALEEHFATLDKLEEEDETEDRDVANDVYEHLEAQFEHQPGQGWRPFRQVVRAHATSLLCNAIEDRLLGPDSLSIMVTHCLNVSAWDEAERMLLAYIPRMEVLPMPVCLQADLFNMQKQPFLSLFKSFVDRTGRYRLLYSLLEYMVALDLLPLEWLATECMRPLWDRLVRSISENDHRTRDSAYQFMETATLASMGLPDARFLEEQVAASVSRRFVPSSREDLRLALNTTFSSLLTVLCSIALVSSNREDPVGKSVAQRIARALDTTLIALSTRGNIRDELQRLDADGEDVQVFAQRALWVNFAAFVVHLEGCSHTAPTVVLTAASYGSILSWTAAQFNVTGVNSATVFTALPALIASIARGTGRIWQDDGFDQIQRLVAAFMSTSRFRLPHKLWTLKRLALESAMEFAYSTGDVEHMIFARSIEQTMRNQGRLVIVNSPDKDAPPTASGGFKWEEGIGEWVACTPFAKQIVQRQPRKAVRALDLLPTPGPSEDEMAESCATKNGQGHDGSMWDTTAFDSDEEDALPDSSPIKLAPLLSSSSLGKRVRASSPMVLIPAKRPQTTPPDTPSVRFYTEPLSDQLDQRQQSHRYDAPRRSRRSTRHLHALTSRLRTQRSQTSLERGLRNIGRSAYTEQDEADDSYEEDDSFSSSRSSPRSSPPKPRYGIPRTRSSRRTCPSTHISNASNTTNRDAITNHHHHDNNPDELSTTPTRHRFIPPRTAPSTRKRPLHTRIRTATVAHSDASGSEDDLSLP